jgi:hypothetical protein
MHSLNTQLQNVEGKKGTLDLWISKYLLEQRQTLKRAMPSYAGILKYGVVPTVQLLKQRQNMHDSNVAQN